MPLRLCWRLLNKQVYFQSFPHPKCVRIEMVNIPNQTFAGGWSVGRCPIAANCSPESHFSMEFKLLLNSVTHLSKWDHWTRLVCTRCNKIGMFSSLKMRMFDFFDNRDKCCKPGFLRGNIWVNFPRTGKMVKMWHLFIFWSSAATKQFDFLNFSQLFWRVFTR